VDYSGFDSAPYRKLEVKWHSPKKMPPSMTFKWQYVNRNRSRDDVADLEIKHDVEDDGDAEKCQAT